MKQTAVEFLVSHLIEYGFDLSLHKIEIEQAKKIQKQQQDDYAIAFTEWLCDEEITKEEIKTRLEIFKNK